MLDRKPNVSGLSSVSEGTVGSLSAQCRTGLGEAQCKRTAAPLSLSARSVLAIVVQGGASAYSPHSRILSSVSCTWIVVLHSSSCERGVKSGTTYVTIVAMSLPQSESKKHFTKWGSGNGGYWGQHKPNMLSTRYRRFSEEVACRRAI